MRAWRSVFVVLVIAIGFLFGGQLKANADDTPNCATHGEWDNVTVFMSPSRVAEIVGNDGWFIDTANPETFARGYNLCWTGSFGKVWFEIPSRLSFRKDVI